MDHDAVFQELPEWVAALRAPAESTEPHERFIQRMMMAALDMRLAAMEARAQSSSAHEPPGDGEATAPADAEVVG
jgi:hypothetical protein